MGLNRVEQFTQKKGILQYYYKELRNMVFKITENGA